MPTHVVDCTAQVDEGSPGFVYAGFDEYPSTLNASEGITDAAAVSGTTTKWTTPSYANVNDMLDDWGTGQNAFYWSIWDSSDPTPPPDTTKAYTLIARVRGSNPSGDYNLSIFTETNSYVPSFYPFRCTNLTPDYTYPGSNNQVFTTSFAGNTYVDIVFELQYDVTQDGYYSGVPSLDIFPWYSVGPGDIYLDTLTLSWTDDIPGKHAYYHNGAWHLMEDLV